MLYIVATPIGNLDDMTLRAIKTLKEVDLILAEDTRNTQKLLNHFEIKNKVISFHEHTEDSKFDRVLEELESGKSLAIVTDAGTPRISDPGARLINFIREKNSEIKIVAIPGASALSTALSISGMKGHEFIFLGFPPHKKGRETFFKQITDAEMPVMIYESTHRLVKAIETLNKMCPEKNVKIFKELTKIYENVLIGKPEELLQELAENPQLLRGEFVILIE